MHIRGTTILAVKKDDKITVAGDGQVTLDTTILKHGARKVRRLFNNEVIVGFAGATADAFTLFDRFDQKLEQYNGNLLRAAVELTKDWRTDRVLRHLEALMIAVSRDYSLIISGNGDVIESDDDVMAIGSGGALAQAAARAASRHRAVTSAPRAKSASTTGVPMNPVAPVTSTRRPVRPASALGIRFLPRWRLGTCPARLGHHVSRTLAPRNHSGLARKRARMRASSASASAPAGAR